MRTRAIRRGLVPAVLRRGLSPLLLLVLVVCRHCGCWRGISVAGRNLDRVDVGVGEKDEKGKPRSLLPCQSRVLEELEVSNGAK